jgi:hypothetical protein
MVLMQWKKTCQKSALVYVQSDQSYSFIQIHNPLFLVISFGSNTSFASFSSYSRYTISFTSNHYSKFANQWSSYILWSNILACYTEWHQISSCDTLWWISSISWLVVYFGALVQSEIDNNWKRTNKNVRIEVIRNRFMLIQRKLDV